MSEMSLPTVAKSIYFECKNVEQKGTTEFLLTLQQ